MSTRLPLVERIIDRLSTDESRRVAEMAGAPREIFSSNNNTIVKGWLYMHVLKKAMGAEASKEAAIRAAIIKLVTELCS